MKRTETKDVPEYIAGFSQAIQEKLNAMRDTIRAAAPDVEECIAYGMPTYKQHGVVAHFAAFQKHIGLYALPSGNTAFQDELNGYVTGKGSIQFPLDQAMPLGLVDRMIRMRVAENKSKAENKKSIPQS